MLEDITIVKVVVCALAWVFERFHPSTTDSSFARNFRFFKSSSFASFLKKYHRNATKGFLLATTIAALWNRPLHLFLVDSMALCFLVPAFFISTIVFPRLSFVLINSGAIWLWLHGFLHEAMSIVSAVIAAYALISFPKSFTFGEAWIIARGVVFTTYFAWAEHKGAVPEQFVAVCVSGAVLVCLGGFLSLKVAQFKYPLVSGSIGMATVGFTIVLPKLSSILHEDVVNWMVVFIHHHRHTLGVSLALTIVCIAAISMTQSISSSNLRKAFHGLVTFLFVPILYVDARFLYYSLAFAFVLFVIAEFYRTSAAHPLAGWIDKLTSRYIDAQDSGPLILTPIYLLLGIAIPVWLSSGGGDGGHVHGHALKMSTFAGLMSIGVGDTFAALIGRRYGRVKLFGGRKSLEGLLGSIASQLVFAAVLVLLGVVQVEIVMISMGIVVNACVEATTSQIDNLLIPILTYQLLVTFE
eukprot:m.47302 g.47302  ORF g.47302 m.47302 type:complete len:468 (+) comp7322_c0_seq3:16-1419(+)